ncbi:unnamed protein product [Merluccius merluccius]
MLIDGLHHLFNANIGNSAAGCSGATAPLGGDRAARQRLRAAARRRARHHTVVLTLRFQRSTRQAGSQAKRETPRVQCAVSSLLKDQIVAEQVSDRKSPGDIAVQSQQEPEVVTGKPDRSDAVPTPDQKGVAEAAEVVLSLFFTNFSVEKVLSQATCLKESVSRNL